MKSLYSGQLERKYKNLCMFKTVGGGDRHFADDEGAIGD